MDAKDELKEKFLAVLEKIRLSETERKAAEAFLAGEASLEALDTFTFEDLSKIPGDPAIRLFRELVKLEKRELASRMLLVLLAKGASTCCRMIPMDVIDPEKGAVDTTLYAAQKAAAYAALLGADLYPLGTYSRDCLIQIAGGTPEALCQAIAFEKSASINGKFILLSFYFFLKYQCGSNPGCMAAPEDLPLLGQYEEIAIESLGRLFPDSYPGTAAIQDAIRNGQVTEETRKLAAPKRGVSKQAVRLAGSLAYLNYPLSGKLKDVVKICLAAWMEEALNAMEQVSLATSMDIYTRGGAYDQEFGLASRDYIRWAVSRGYEPILGKQLARNVEAYFEVMNDADYDTAGKMLSVIQKTNAALYEEVIQNRKKFGYSKDFEKLLNKLIRNNADAPAIKAYLRGETPINSLYPMIEKYKDNYYSGAPERKVLDSDYDHIERQDAAFYRRFQSYMLLRRAGYFLRFDIIEYPEPYRPKVSATKVAELFQSFTIEGLDFSRQLSCIGILQAVMHGYDEEQFLDAATDVFRGYLRERREATIRAFAASDLEGRLFGLRVLSEDGDQSKKEVLAYAQDSAKKVRDSLVLILRRRRGWEEEIKELFASKKASVRELALQVLTFWQKKYGTDYRDLFEKALEKEKSQKIRDRLQEALRLPGQKDSTRNGLLKEGGASDEEIFSASDLVAEMHKGNRKRSLAWTYGTPFSAVHTLDGSEAKEEYLQAILLCYSSMSEYGYHKGASYLANALVQEEFAIYVNELFDKWLEAGAEKKKSWVLYAASIHGGKYIVQKLESQIKEWPKHARGVLACEAVRALSLNPSLQALLTVDGISRKFKFRQVQEAAAEAFQFAAKQRGISCEELSDRIVPDLGFDGHARRCFDYGKRSFWATITTAFEVEVFDADGKKRKSLPAPGKSDDAVKAAAAYEAYKEMKKQIKATAGIQKQRLESALVSAREWSVEAWKELFVKNPMMHPFAIGLIWGIYENGGLLQSFRYMEDGSFNTESEEEYTLPANGKIRLIHPIELKEESRDAWTQQLQDYEIIQPIEQLARPFYAITPTEENQNDLLRFQGKKNNSLFLGSKLAGLGWYRGLPEETGSFNSYYRRDIETGMAARLYFSGSSVYSENEEVTIGRVCFHKYQEQDGNRKESKKSCVLRNVPIRYFSEIVHQLTKAIG